VHSSRRLSFINTNKALQHHTIHRATSAELAIELEDTIHKEHTLVLRKLLEFERNIPSPGHLKDDRAREGVSIGLHEYTQEVQAYHTHCTCHEAKKPPTHTPRRVHHISGDFQRPSRREIGIGLFWPAQTQRRLVGS